MIPAPNFLADYISPKGNAKRHKYYPDSCTYAEELITHFDGLKPKKLIEERRPSESKKIQEFRQTIFKSKTKAFADKIQNSLMKIRKSQDWMIKYKHDSSPSIIAPDETLQHYMEVDFPRYESFTNWYFQIGFKIYLTDTNSMCVFMPLNMEINDNEYYKPYPFVFKSENVIDYEYSEWYLLLSEEKNIYTDSHGNKNEGFIYYYVDKEGIYTIRQINPQNGYSIDEFIHGLDYCPVVDFGGVVQKETIYNCLRQSRVYGIVPSFDEAVREYSDLQAEVLQHIHSTMWAHAGQDCKACKGTGMLPKKDSVGVPCKSCFGKGTVPLNPYEYYEIPRPKAGETTITGVPIGYVQKQIDIAELQDKRIRDHIKDGLSAINMEFLIDPPQLVQSGLAKETDKDDMHTFFHVIAEDVIRFFDKCYSIVNDFRYSGIVTDEEKRDDMLPVIPVPEKYDILSEVYLVQEIKMLKDAGIESEIINASLIEYVNKKFYADPETQNFVRNILELDPCSSKTEDVIIIQLTNDGLEQINYNIHCNIREFVSRAVEEDPTFYTLPLLDRHAKMEEYAQEILTANSAKQKVLDSIIPTKTLRVAE